MLLGCFQWRSLVGQRPSLQHTKWVQFVPSLLIALNFSLSNGIQEVTWLLILSKSEGWKSTWPRSFYDMSNCTPNQVFSLWYWVTRRWATLTGHCTSEAAVETWKPKVYCPHQFSWLFLFLKSNLSSYTLGAHTWQSFTNYWRHAYWSICHSLFPMEPSSWLSWFNLYGGLNENVPHRPIDLNT